MNSVAMNVITALREFCSRRGKMKPPEYLYRYRALMAYSREDVEHVLALGQIYFNSPKYFNDPFDSKMLLSKDDGISSKMRETAKEGFDHIQNKLVPSSAVLSLSSRCDNNLMWSHYADSHKGICLKFRRTELKFDQEIQGAPNFSSQGGRYRKDYEPGPIKYSDKFPSISSSAQAHEKLISCLFTKSSDWHCEREWRVLVPSADGSMTSGYRPLKPDALVGIILGCEIRSEDEKLIKEWRKFRNPATPLFQAKKRDGHFGLEIVPVA